MRLSAPVIGIAELADALKVKPESILAVIYHAERQEYPIHLCIRVPAHDHVGRKGDVLLFSRHHARTIALTMGLERAGIPPHLAVVGACTAMQGADELPSTVWARVTRRREEGAKPKIEVYFEAPPEPLGSSFRQIELLDLPTKVDKAFEEAIPLKEQIALGEYRGMTFVAVEAPPLSKELLALKNGEPTRPPSPARPPKGKRSSAYRHPV